MRASTLILVLVAGAALAACGGGSGGVQAPDSVIGTWGADCTQPFVRIEKSQIYMFPDKASYPLKAATLAGGNLTVAYDSSAGPTNEVYAIEGATLRLDHGVYGGSEATWHKQPMKKCS